MHAPRDFVMRLCFDAWLVKVITFANAHHFPAFEVPDDELEAK